MRRIERLNLTETSFKIFENIINAKTRDNKATLLLLKNDIKELFSVYEASKSDLFPMIPKGYLNDNRAALLHCYNGDTEPTKKYKKEIKLLENRKCPYCYLENSCTVEHYLPKEEFPEFAFLIDNLFPCCSTCNSKKGEVWRDSVGRVILNFYFDSIPNEKFLFAKVKIVNDTPTASFNINTSNVNITPHIKVILEKHIDRLNLLERYSESINSQISELQHTVYMYKDKISNIDIKELCSIEAEIKKNTFGNNYFVTSLYEAIRDNDEVIEFLFKKA